MYIMDGRVRYSEVDSDGIITLDAIVNYLQDCVMLHSEEVGRGVCNMANNEGFWLMASWQIEIIRAPRYHEVIRVATNPYEFKGVFGGRNVQILDAEGGQLVRANSIWVYIDAATKAPARVPKHEAEAYTHFSDKIDMEYMPRKIALPDGMRECAPIPVTPDRIDTNRHVNNCEYVRAAMEAADFYGLPRVLRVEYKQAAVMGDYLCPEMYRDEKHCVVELHGRDKTPFAVAEFIF
ncbi:MAG: thioesterase [Butyrivibrio sp.]|nr:thioesterase [Butyrivibrio sp.]